MTSVKKNRRSEGIVLVVIGSIVFFGLGGMGVLWGLQSSAYRGAFIIPTVLGVLIIVLGLFFRAISSGTIKQAKPIT